MSQSSRILAVLADGKPHSVPEIHERAGTCRLNSRIAELRSRGHDIVCTREIGNGAAAYSYQLTSATGPNEDASPSLETVFAGAFTTAGDAPSVAEPAEQLSFGSAPGQWPYASSESRAA